MAPDADGSYLDEIAQPSIEHSGKTEGGKNTKEKFEPWHKPRKQWVRSYQWGLESKRLIELLKISAGRPLRYLSLPGPDMLDVRWLHGVCAEAQTKLKFVGYIVPGQNDMAELELSESEVRDMPFIDSESSRIVRANFQSLADSASIATRAVSDEDAFDVINIDLCNCVGEYAPLDSQRAYYESIKSLFTLQVKKRQVNEPWLFFVTTRADFDKVHGDARTGFFRLLRSACQGSAELRVALQEKLGVSEQDIVDCAAGKVNSNVVFELAFAAALVEWLAHLLANFTPQVDISLLPSSRAYGVRAPRKNDMLSLGFRCETVFCETSDGSGLSSNSSDVRPPARVEEYPSVARMVEVLAGLLNLDEVFREPSAYRRIATMAADFLQTARFSRERYWEWAWNRPEAPSASKEIM